MTRYNLLDPITLDFLLGAVGTAPERTAVRHQHHLVAVECYEELKTELRERNAAKRAEPPAEPKAEEPEAQDTDDGKKLSEATESSLSEPRPGHRITGKVKGL